MKQTRIYHDRLNIEDEYDYSEGWLQKFKKCHGIKYLNLCDEKASANPQTIENYIDEYSKIVFNENFSPEQIHNADETVLYCCYVPRKTLTITDDMAPTDFKDAKQMCGLFYIGFKRTV